ncbi:cation transporter [Bacillus sp. mrc49]|uniref:cation transporter n=1 Tax=Bacillus sp. mrc49 TaxID=2054913 RepID=UPI000C270645|nr:cation transporter [Bacillus sp. mrc49]PJN88506.1 hypothetical protein CVN76_20210 [Bacillus sp. mrc49]
MAEPASKTYRIQGLSCTNCAAKFENNVRGLEGVRDAKINFGASKISVQGSATIQEKKAIVKYRKEGKLAFYSLDDHHIKQLILIASEHQREVRSDG